MMKKCKFFLAMRIIMAFFEKLFQVKIGEHQKQVNEKEEGGAKQNYYYMLAKIYEDFANAITHIKVTSYKNSVSLEAVKDGIN